MRLRYLTPLLILFLTAADCVPAQFGAPIEQQAILADNTALFGRETVIMRFDPPPIYDTWYAQVEACIGKHVDGRPTYWVAQTPLLTMPNGQRAMGAWASPSRRIVFALGYESIAFVVRHEMMHDVLQLTGEHPAEYFGTVDSLYKCGHLVQFPREHQAKGGE